MARASVDVVVTLAPKQLRRLEAAAAARSCAPAHGLVAYLLDVALARFFNCIDCEGEPRTSGGHFADIVHERRCELARRINEYEPGRALVDGSRTT